MRKAKQYRKVPPFTKPKRKISYKQTGTVKSLKRDKALPAKIPGWRRGSKGWYFEARKNRSDKIGKRV